MNLLIYLLLTLSNKDTPSSLTTHLVLLVTLSIQGFTIYTLDHSDRLPPFLMAKNKFVLVVQNAEIGYVCSKTEPFVSFVPDGHFV